MSKRLTRIRPENIARQLENKDGTELHIVLENGQTLLGRLRNVNATSVLVSDARDHLHSILVSDIYEIIFDVVGQK